MQWGRIKSILMVILLLVDVFLIGILGIKWVNSQNREREMFKNLQTVLAYNGITIQDMTLPSETMIPQLCVDQSRTDELKVAYMLLGDDAPEVDSESGLNLKNNNGEVCWDDTGAITANLTPEDYQKPEKSAVKEQAMAILEKCDMAPSGLELEIDGYKVNASFRTAGYEVFNRNMDIIFNDDSITISGRWTFSEPYATRDELYSAYNPIDSLIWFSQQKKANIINSVEAGLLLVNGAGNQMQLSPVWKIETDKGVYYVDPAKNELL